MPYIEFSDPPRNISRLFPLVVLDTETTGLSATKDEIIEVSAIRFEDSFTPSSCFTALCRPLRGIGKEASEVHHITEEMVEDKPLFQEVAPQLSQFISGCNIAGYNVLFDLKFLYVGGTEFDLSRKFYDVYQIAKNAIPEDDVYDFKLDTLCDNFLIYRPDAHRSLSDSLATAKLLEELVTG